MSATVSTVDAKPSLPSLPEVDEAVYVGFDVDDVCANLREVVAQCMSRRLGVEVDWRDWQQYGVFTRYGLTLEQFLGWIVEDDVLQACAPEPGAALAMDQARAAGAKVVVCTARGYHPQADAVTSAWFASHGFVVDRKMFVSANGSKFDALDSLPNLVSYIDDNSDHLEELRERGLRAHLTLMDRPWNQQTQGFDRLHDLRTYGQTIADLAAARLAELKRDPAHTLRIDSRHPRRAL